MGKHKQKKCNFFSLKITINTNTLRKLKWGILIQNFLTERALTQYLAVRFRNFQPITTQNQFLRDPSLPASRNASGRKRPLFEKDDLSLTPFPPFPLISTRTKPPRRERGEEGGEEDMRKRSNHPRSVSNNRVAVLFILAFFLSVAGTVSVIRGPIFTHAFCFRARWMSDNEAWGL